LFNLYPQVVAEYACHTSLDLGSLWATTFTIVLKDTPMFYRHSSKPRSQTASHGHSLTDMVAMGSTIALALWMASMRLGAILP
jgi:hypothetical protein